jgi:hypothetical protein
VLDYPELQAYTGMSSREKFFEAYDMVYNHGQKTGEFPRLRIWMAGDENMARRLIALLESIQVCRKIFNAMAFNRDLADILHSFA